MIPYEKSFLGVDLLFRFHGSPILRAVIPSILSTLFFVLLDIYVDKDTSQNFITHPYGIGVLISSISFLIVFRANYGYQRYWNACGDVHQMMSKWLDAVTHTACYHMQQHHYDHMKPPSYFDNHDLNKYRLSRDREVEGEVMEFRKKGKVYKKSRALSKSIQSVSIRNISLEDDNHLYHNDSMRVPSYLIGEGRRDGGWGLMLDDGSSTYFTMDDPQSWEENDQRGFASTNGGRTHSLFLQELVHLASLTCAVSFSTLRNDVDGAESPLDFYTPGSPWPNVDPDSDKKSWKKATTDLLRYMSGYDRTPERRTKHNALRPLSVLGGVSKNEIAFLQKARGASAKVNLAWQWLSEFIIREHLAGSLGDVGPPIISRIFQFLSDGMIFYNHARKTMFIPFPFPHAQISALFVLTTMVSMPLLMLEYSNNIYLGALLNFFTVTCLAGLHEVARELENPYRNVPNEIPLCTLQAMFNEALVTLYAGYHPDHFWEGDDYRFDKHDNINKSTKQESNMSRNTPQAPLNKFDSNTNESDAMSLKEIQEVVLEQKKEIDRLRALVGDIGNNHNITGKAS